MTERVNIDGSELHKAWTEKGLIASQASAMIGRGHGTLDYWCRTGSMPALAIPIIEKNLGIAKERYVLSDSYLANAPATVPKNREENVPTENRYSEQIKINRQYIRDYFEEFISKNHTSWTEINEAIGHPCQYISNTTRSGYLPFAELRLLCLIYGLDYEKATKKVVDDKPEINTSKRDYYREMLELLNGISDKLDALLKTKENVICKKSKSYRRSHEDVSISHYESDYFGITFRNEVFQVFKSKRLVVKIEHNRLFFIEDVNGRQITHNRDGINRYIRVKGCGLKKFIGDYDLKRAKDGRYFIEKESEVENG